MSGMINFHLLSILTIALACSCLPAPAHAAEPFLTGFDANYALEMARSGKTWAGNKNLYAPLAAAGANAFRVRLWTGDEGVNGLRYATETARRAQEAGMKPYLVIFLSEGWADMVKQPAPAMWKDLDEPQKLAAIEAYTAKVTKHFIDAGVNVDLYEIGNEIDFGICGVFEVHWPRRVSIEYMRAHIFSKMVPIIAAAQRGVRSADPEARFMLHLAQWHAADYCVAFFDYMTTNGITLDYAGLSYFPTSAKLNQSSLAFFATQVKIVATGTGRPVIVCEYAFPSRTKFGGQFGDWDKPVEGYELDEPGQAKWVADFLSLARTNKDIAGAFYWSPEWYGSNMWEAFALFRDDGTPKPAMKSFVMTP
jgi:arabinogalactan endo-1,4-beta-galactosidase